MVNASLNSFDIYVYLIIPKLKVRHIQFYDITGLNKSAENCTLSPVFQYITQIKLPF